MNSAPSNFTKNLLIQKDAEIGQLKSSIDTLKSEKQAIEESMWKLQKEGLDSQDGLKSSYEVRIQSLETQLKDKETEFTRQIE